MLNTALWLWLTLACLAFLPFYLTMERNNLFEFMNLLLVAVAAGTAIGFHPAAVNAMKLPARDLTAGQILVTGVVLASLAVMAIFIGQFVWRAYGRPAWIADHASLAFSRWFLLIAWVLSLLASGSDSGPLPVSTYKRAGVIVFISIAVLAVFMTFGVGWS